MTTEPIPAAPKSSEQGHPTTNTGTSDHGSRDTRSSDPSASPRASEPGTNRTGTAGMAQPETTVRIVLLDAELEVPGYAHAGDAGADLRSRVEVHLEPGQRQLVPTGIALELPDGLAGFVHPRSGLAHRLGLGMVNAPGVIDAGYRGEVMVNLVNHDPSTPITLHRGDRIAQLVIQQVVRARFEVVDALDDTERGQGGHGSSGVTMFPGQRHL